MPSKWRTITINLTHEQSRQLKALAGLKGLSQSAYLKLLLEIQVNIRKDLASLLDKTDAKAFVDSPYITDALRYITKGEDKVADDPFTVSGERQGNNE